jgi:hypothetical protein
MGKTLQSKTPILKQGLPEKSEATKKESEYDDSGLLKMFTAIRVQKTPNELERELNRLNIPSNKVFSSTGDPVIDAQAKKILAPQLLDNMYPALKNDRLFQQGDDDVKRSMMEDYLSREQAAAKKAAISFDVDKQKEAGKQSRIFAVQYGKLSAPDQRRTSQMYKDFTGKDLADTEDYQGAMSIYQDVKSMTKPSSLGAKKFSEGGLATSRVLSDEEVSNRLEWQNMQKLKREGGATGNKGLGYFGELPSVDSEGRPSRSTELAGEAEGIHFPLLVPTLTKKEMDHLLSGKPATDEIWDKAYEHALMRGRGGKDPFATQYDKRHKAPSFSLGAKR